MLGEEEDETLAYGASAPEDACSNRLLASCRAVAICCSEKQSGMRNRTYRTSWEGTETPCLEGCTVRGYNKI